MSDNNDEIKALEREREELNLLVQRGVKFDVTTKIRRRKKGLRGFFSRPETVNETHTFEIHEPTLSVLDRISALSLAIDIDEATIKAEGEAAITEARQVTKENIMRMRAWLPLPSLVKIPCYRSKQVRKSQKVQ